MRDQLGDGPAHRRRVLQAVAGEAVGEIEVGDLRVGADDCVLIESVVGVVAGPGRCPLDRREGRDAGGQRRPHDLLEPAVLDLEIEAIGILVLGRRDAADVLVALGADIDPAGVDQQGHAAGPLAAIEDIDDALARADRQIDAGHRRDLGRAGATGIDEGAGPDLLPRGEMGAPDAGFVEGQPDDPVLDVFRAKRARLAAEGVQQGVGIEPALARQSERAEGDSPGRKPWETGGQRGRLQQGDVGPEGCLDRVVGFERRPAGLARQEQIPALVQADIRGLAIDRQLLRGGAQEVDPEERHLDIFPRRELLADRAARARGRAIGVAGIGLDHQDAPAEPPIGAEEIGNRAADHPAAGDHHIVCSAHARLRVAAFGVRVKGFPAAGKQRQTTGPSKPLPVPRHSL